MESLSAISPTLNATQSPIFITRPNAVPYIRAPQKLIKSMKTLQNESTKKSMNLLYKQKNKMTEAEQDKLYEEYVQINREIALLECELMPLREKCTNLRQKILSFQSIYSDEENLNFFQPPNFSSAFIEIQNESNQLNQELTDTQECYSNQSIEKMQLEIEQEIHFCELLSASNASFKKQAEEIQLEIDRYRNSQFYQSVQNQRNNIFELTQELEDAKHKHRALKAEHFRLTDPILQREEKNVHEADSIIKLQRKLNALNYKQISLSDQYIQLREKQMKEIEAMTTVIQKEDSLLDIPFFQNQNHRKSEFRSRSSVFNLDASNNSPPNSPKQKEKLFPLKPVVSMGSITLFNDISQSGDDKSESKKAENNYNSLLVPAYYLNND